MSVPDTTVTHGHRLEQLPTLQVGVNGSLIQVLKAILVDGWGETPVMAMTFDGATGLVTATFAEEHQFTYPQVIEVTGANEPQYNGRWRIAEIPGTHDVKFAIPGVPSGDATGTLYMKCGAAGWTMPLISTDGNIAYFEPQHLRGGTYAIRIKDDNTLSQGPTSYGQYVAEVAVVSSYTNETTYTEEQYYSQTCIPTGSTAGAVTDSPKTVGDPVTFAFVANPHNLYLKIKYHDTNEAPPLDERASSITHFGYLASRRQTPDFAWSVVNFDSNEQGYYSVYATRFLWGSSTRQNEVSHGSTGSASPVERCLLPEIYEMGNAGEITTDNPEIRYHFPIRYYIGSQPIQLTYVGHLPGVGHLLRPPTLIPNNTIMEIDGAAFIYLISPTYGSRSTHAISEMGACIIQLDKPWPTGV